MGYHFSDVIMRIKEFVQKHDLPSALGYFYCPSHYINKEGFSIQPGEFIVLSLPSDIRTNIYSWPAPEHNGHLVAGQISILIKNSHPTRKIFVPRNYHLHVLLRRNYVESQEFFAPLSVLPALIDKYQNNMCFDVVTTISD